MSRGSIAARSGRRSTRLRQMPAEDLPDFLAEPPVQRARAQQEAVVNRAEGREFNRTSARLLRYDGPRRRIMQVPQQALSRDWLGIS
jgi:hypothetical protein